MRLTKFGHSCIQLASDAGTVVVDPGILTEDAALDGADAVLITHEHPDHLDVDKLRSAFDANAELGVWTNPALAEQLAADFPGRVTAVSAGSRVDIVGFDVRTFGTDHAVIRDGLPILANTGFLIDDVFHPGDAFTVPEHPVDTLLLPLNAPWAKVSETVEQLARIAPKRVHPVHDGLLTAPGVTFYGNHTEAVANSVGADFHRLEPGESVTR